MDTYATMDWFKDKNLRADELLFYACMSAFFAIPLGTAPMNICGILAITIWLFSGKALRDLHILIRHSWFWPVLLLIILPWIGLLYSPDVTGVGLKYAKKTHYWIYAIIVASLAVSNFKADKLIQAYIAGLTVNSIAAMFQIGFILRQGRPLPNDLGLGPGYTSMIVYLIVGIMVCAFYFNQSSEKRQRIYLALLMCLFFFHLIMMKGRNGYFTFLVISPLIFGHLMKRVHIFKIFFAYCLIAALMALSPAVRNQIALTVKQINLHINAPSNASWGKEYIPGEDRVWIMANALKVFKQHPLFGVGTGGFQTVVQQNGKPDWPLVRHPHNNFLYMAVSFGLVGVWALTWLFWELIKNSWHLRNTLTGYFVFSSTLVLFVSGFMNTQIINAGTGFLLAIATGLQEEFPRFSSHLTDTETANLSRK
jgi:O-antigen ligase